MLIPADATLYDIGQGQRLMMRCKGRGAPTVILESPAGGYYNYNSVSSTLSKGLPWSSCIGVSVIQGWVLDIQN